MNDWSLWVGIGLLCPLGIGLVYIILFQIISNTIIYFKEIRPDPKRKKERKKNVQKFVKMLKETWWIILTIITYCTGLVLLSSYRATPHYIGIALQVITFTIWIIAFIIFVISYFKPNKKPITQEVSPQ